MRKFGLPYEKTWRQPTNWLIIVCVFAPIPMLLMIRSGFGTLTVTKSIPKNYPFLVRSSGKWAFQSGRFNLQMVVLDWFIVMCFSYIIKGSQSLLRKAYGLIEVMMIHNIACKFIILRIKETMHHLLYKFWLFSHVWSRQAHSMVADLPTRMSGWVIFSQRFFPNLPERSSPHVLLKHLPTCPNDSLPLGKKVPFYPRGKNGVVKLRRVPKTG